MLKASVRFLLIGLALTLGGCGSDETSTVAASGPPLATSRVAGQVRLDGPVGGAAVRVSDASGRELASLTTGSHGYFFYDGELPRGGQVTASFPRQGQTVVLSRQLEGQEKLVVLDVPPVVVVQASAGGVTANTTLYVQR